MSGASRATARSVPSPAGAVRSSCPDPADPGAGPPPEYRRRRSGLVPAAGAARSTAVAAAPAVEARMMVGPSGAHRARLCQLGRFRRAHAALRPDDHHDLAPGRQRAAAAARRAPQDQGRRPGSPRGPGGHVRQPRGPGTSGTGVGGTAGCLARRAPPALQRPRPRIAAPLGNAALGLPGTTTSAPTSVISSTASSPRSPLGIACTPRARVRAGSCQPGQHPELKVAVADARDYALRHGACAVGHVSPLAGGEPAHGGGVPASGPRQRSESAQRSGVARRPAGSGRSPALHGLSGR